MSFERGASSQGPRLPTPPKSATAAADVAALAPWRRGPCGLTFLVCGRCRGRVRRARTFKKKGEKPGWLTEEGERVRRRRRRRRDAEHHHQLRNTAQGPGRHGADADADVEGEGEAEEHTDEEGVLGAGSATGTMARADTGRGPKEARRRARRRCAQEERTFQLDMSITATGLQA